MRGRDPRQESRQGGAPSAHALRRHVGGSVRVGCVSTGCAGFADDASHVRSGFSDSNGRDRATGVQGREDPARVEARPRSRHDGRPVHREGWRRGNVKRFWTIFYLLVAVLATAPAWIVRYPPLEDLPFHVSTLRQIHSFADPAYGFSSDFFLNLTGTQYALY